MWFLVILIVITALSEKVCLEYGENLWTTNNVRENQVVFYLFNRQNVDQPIRISKNMNEVDFAKDLKFMIHGYFENADAAWYKDLTTEYLKKGDYNVIQVDWSGPASAAYPISCRNAQGVGHVIGKLIVKLYSYYNLSLDKVHVIGHSLGAHVAGHTGKGVIKCTGFKVFRITALDAAGPLFEGPALMFEGIGKYDANIVEAIHTDGGVFGRKNSFADVDFFPNGGIAPQPGCDLINLLIPSANYVELKREVFCSHIKSYHFFIASVNQENFIGVKCHSWNDYVLGKCNEGPTTAVMGDNYVFSNETTGVFFLKTNAKRPFARN